MENQDTQPSQFQASDVLKPTARIALPLVSVLYSILGLAFDLSGVEWVLGGLALLTLGLNVFIELTTREYDGEVHILDSEDGKTFRLSLDKTLEELEGMEGVSFKVIRK